MVFRRSNKTMIYCGRLQRPMPVLSAKKVLDVLQHASGPFSPAALASAFSLDLVTTLVLLECLRLKWTGCDPHVQQPWGCFPIDLSFPRGYYHFYGCKIRLPIRCATKQRLRASENAIDALFPTPRCSFRCHSINSQFARLLAS